MLTNDALPRGWQLCKKKARRKQRTMRKWPTESTKCRNGLETMEFLSLSLLSSFFLFSPGILVRYVCVCILPVFELRELLYSFFCCWFRLRKEAAERKNTEVKERNVRGTVFVNDPPRKWRLARVTGTRVKRVKLKKKIFK